MMTHTHSRTRVCVIVCVCVCVCVCVWFICIVQCSWACLTWKSAIEIKSSSSSLLLLPTFSLSWKVQNHQWPVSPLGNFHNASLGSPPVSPACGCCTHITTHHSQACRDNSTHVTTHHSQACRDNSTHITTHHSQACRDNSRICCLHTADSLNGFYMHVFHIFVFAPVQRSWACFTWKGALEIRSLLLLLLLLLFSQAHCQGFSTGTPFSSPLLSVNGSDNKIKLK